MITLITFWAKATPTHHASRLPRRLPKAIRSSPRQVLEGLQGGGSRTIPNGRFIFSFSTLVSHTQFCHFSTILPFAGMHNQPPQARIQVSDRTDALCQQKSRFSGVFHHRSVSLPGGLQVEDDPAARRLQRRPSIFFLTDESWVSIFCGVMISDRGMIIYSGYP